MKLLMKILAYFIGNAVGLLLAAKYIDGFLIDPDIQSLVTLSLLLMAANIFIKPAVKLILTPFIWLTLGFATLIINAGILYLIDILSERITINGLAALVYGTLILGATNIISILSAKLFTREETKPNQ